MTELLPWIVGAWVIGPTAAWVGYCWWSPRRKDNGQ